MKKIKKQTCRSYELWTEGGKLHRKLKKKSLTRYDCTGRKIERLEYDYWRYTYERRRSLRTGIWYTKKLANSPRISRHTYVYDGKCLMSECFYRPIDKLTGKIVYERDSEGREIHSKYCKVDGELIWESYYGYDKNGRKKKWIDFHPDLDEIAISYYCYDKVGRNTATECCSKLAGYLYYKYKYDKSGNPIEEAQYSKPGVLDLVSVYAYNEGGHKVRCEFFHQGKASEGWIIYERDENGNLIASRNYDCDGRLVCTSESKYNRYGHIISSLETNFYCDVNGVRPTPVELDEFEYEYFK